MERDWLSRCPELTGFSLTPFLCSWIPPRMPLDIQSLPCLLNFLWAWTGPQTFLILMNLAVSKMTGLGF